MTGGRLVAASMLIFAASGGVLAFKASRAAAPAAGTHVVEIRDFQFIPAHLTVKQGDTVRWINHDVAPHTATAADHAWNSGNMVRDAEWTWVAGAPGEVSYLCLYHPAMTGSITVEAAAPSP